MLTILQPERTGHMIRSLLAHQQQSVHGVLPVWSHHANENWCMIGYHSVPVIADAFVKGLREFDADRALEAMIASANFDRYDGIGDYRALGYVPADRHSNSASKTLEFAYDDWTTARKADGSFPAEFDAMSTHGQGYIEGNAWNYSLYVPHGIWGFMDLLGGPNRLVTWLDSLFVMEVDDESIAHNGDITRAGIIGNYVHGNERSHHVSYLYCFAGQPWKTQARVRQIMEEMYRPVADGL
jgi:putative alpha-1,2-mannosidase